MIRLSANELPYKQDLSGFNLEALSLNRYPDKDYTALKQQISKRILNESCDNTLTLGNGSDELIWLIFATLLKAGEQIITHTPCFSEYDRMAKLCGLKVNFAPATEDLSIDLEALKALGLRSGAKMAVICRPNNPTGEVISKADLINFLNRFPGYVLLDEAYMDFSKSEDATDLVKEYPNLILLRTLSKAYGLAGLRLGYAISSPSVAKSLNDSRPPYNINAITESVAMRQLDSIDLKGRIELLVSERQSLESKLRELNVRFCPSEANFLLLTNLDQRFQMSGEAFSQKLLSKGIQIRVFSESPLENCARVSIGTPEENQLFIEAVSAL